MTELSNLSETQLKKRIQETQAELAHRTAIFNATKEIKKILQTNNLTVDDNNIKQLLLNSSSKSANRVIGKTSKQKKKRAKVAPKFKSFNTSQKWTGRGRAPKWVVALCEAENITIEAFKNDPRFQT